MLFLAIGALLVARAAAPAPSPSSSPAPLQIFAGTFRRLASYPVPPYAVWTDTWHVRQYGHGLDGVHDASYVATHRYAVRTGDGMESENDPTNGRTLPPASIQMAFIGPFAWSIRRWHRPPKALQRGEVMMQPDVASGLKSIATVTATAKPAYAIRIAGIDVVDGHATYHLVLKPADDPELHNLRDLWVDVHTGDLMKAHFIGVYAPDPMALPSTSDATAYFTYEDGYWIAYRQVWTYDTMPASYLFDAETDRIAFPATLPDWVFDARAYRKEENRGAPDIFQQAIDGELPTPPASP